LLLLDLNVQLVIESTELATPPETPVFGQCWVVASGASGAWLGQVGAIAGWTTNGWLFALPRAGWRAWDLSRGHGIRFDSVDWTDDMARSDGYYVDGERVVAARQAAIAEPSSGVTQDAEARDAVAAILVTLRAHWLIDA